MTISAYQVDNVIKAYSKQIKAAKVRLDVHQNSMSGKYADFVTLSGEEFLKADANKKISYSLLDVLLKERKVVP